MKWCWDAFAHLYQRGVFQSPTVSILQSPKIQKYFVGLPAFSWGERPVHQEGERNLLVSELSYMCGDKL